MVNYPTGAQEGGSSPTHRVVVSRVIRAAVERVYRAWTDPATFQQWFIPNERWFAPTAILDVREGGAFSIEMAHSDGEVFTMVGHYLAVTPNERLTFTFATLGQGDENAPEIVDVHLQPTPGGTQLTITHERIGSAETAASHEEGWTEFLTALDSYFGN